MIDPQQPDFHDHPGSSRRPRPHYQAAQVLLPPAVSIITPCFNPDPALLAATADSVLAQSLQQFEWILIDDGSTDPASQAALRAYRTDSRVRLISHAHNRGLAAARNTGFAAAQAEFVLQLDSDDLIEPTAAEVWAWYLLSHPAAGFVKGYSVGFGAQQYLWRQGFAPSKHFLHQNMVDPTCMVRLSTYYAAGGYDQALREGLEDWDFWLRCANAGHWGATIPLFLNWYRRRADHSSAWPALTPTGLRTFRRRARSRYPQLWRTGMPANPAAPAAWYGPPPTATPFTNLLLPAKPPVLLLLADFGPQAAPLLSLAQQLVATGHPLTVVATDGPDTSLLAAFARLSPDLFSLPLFLSPADQPRFLSYLVQSRQATTLLVADAMLGMLLLPSLRARTPALACALVCCASDPADRERRPGWLELAQPWVNAVWALDDQVAGELVARGGLGLPITTLAAQPDGAAALAQLHAWHNRGAAPPLYEPELIAHTQAASVAWLQAQSRLGQLQAQPGKNEAVVVRSLRWLYYRLSALGCAPPAWLRDLSVAWLRRRSG